MKAREVFISAVCPVVWLFFYPVDCSLPGSCVHGILQAGMLEWAAISSSRELAHPRDRTCVSHISGIGRWFIHYWTTGKPVFITRCSDIRVEIVGVDVPNVMKTIKLLNADLKNPMLFFLKTFTSVYLKLFILLLCACIGMCIWKYCDLLQTSVTFVGEMKNRGDVIISIGAVGERTVYSKWFWDLKG